MQSRKSDIETIEPTNDENSPIAFFSSRFAGFEDFRKKIYELGQSLGQSIWVAEHSEPSLTTRPSEEIIDVCLKKVRDARLFLCVLEGGYGQSASLNLANVSLLELELFQAALGQKSIHIYLLEPFYPDPRLESFLHALQIVYPDAIRPCTNKEEALERIKRLVHRQTRRLLFAPFTLPIKIFRLLVQQLARSRSSAYPGISVLRDIRFLDAAFAPYSPSADRDLVQALIEEARSTSHQPTRLARSWMAIRHLCAAPYTDPKYSDFLPLWDESLSNWASASAWYGLHGHIYLGRLAAVNTLLDIRQRTPIHSHGMDPTIQVHGTRGAIASEYYSISKTVPSRRDQRILLEEALSQVEMALDVKRTDRSGLLAIRGSVLLALGRLEEAILDYLSVLRLREEEEEEYNPGRIGEAKAELGYAYLQAGRFREAQSCLEAGVALLESTNSGGFTVSAKKKLALYYFRTGRPRLALQQLAEAYALPVRTGLMTKSRG